MKKTLLLSLITITLNAILVAAPVTPERARQVAVNFWNSHYPDTQKPVDDMQPVIVDGLANMYFFANGEEGFVIVSADDRLRPVLGYSFDTPFSKEVNPELRYWLSGYEQRIEALKEGERAADPRWLTVDNVPEAPVSMQMVNPLVETQWDQGSPYNRLCPYDTTYHMFTWVGCAATAMAQVMKRWNHPSCGTGSHSYVHYDEDNPGVSYGMLSADFAHTTYRWEEMRNSYSSGMGYPDVEIMPVATISYHCGVALDMMYGVSGSGAYITCGAWNTSCVVSAFVDYFKYKPTLTPQSRENFTESMWAAMVDADLAAGRPVYYSGRDVSGGHAFILDGSNLDTMYHFNWGWSGYGDGFYYLNNLAPSATGAGGNASHTYNLSQVAVFGIEPDEELIDTIDVYDTVCSNRTTFTFRDYTIPAVTCDTMFRYLDTIFYLHLARVSMKVAIFRPNGAEGDEFSQQFCITDGIAMPECPFTRSDSLVFAGWCTNRNCSGTVYHAGDMVRLSSNTTFYAKWRDPSVGIDDVKEADIMLWPNPMCDELTLVLPAAGECYLFDAMGRMLIRRSLSAGESKVQVGDLPAGLYTVQVRTSEGIYNKRVIKR